MPDLNELEQIIQNIFANKMNTYKKGPMGPLDVEERPRTPHFTNFENRIVSTLFIFEPREDPFLEKTINNLAEHFGVTLENDGFDFDKNKIPLEFDDFYLKFGRTNYDSNKERRIINVNGYIHVANQLFFNGYQIDLLNQAIQSYETQIANLQDSIKIWNNPEITITEIKNRGNEIEI
jgi:hypothetical protein